MTKKFACLLLCFVIITSFIGCSNNSDNVPASSTATIIPVEENLALKKFENAASRLNDEKMLKQDIKIKTTDLYNLTKKVDFSTLKNPQRRGILTKR